MDSIISKQLILKEDIKKNIDRLNIKFKSV